MSGRLAWVVAMLGLLPACAEPQPGPGKAGEANRQQIVATAAVRGVYSYSLAYVPSRDLVLVGHAFGLQAFNGTTLEEQFRVDLKHTVRSIAVTPDGQLMALAVGGQSDLKVYSLETRALLKEWSGYKTGSVQRVATSPDGRFLAATAAAGTIAKPWDNATRVWDWREGRLVLETRDPVKVENNMHSGIAFNPRKTVFYETCASNDPRQASVIASYDTSTWKPLSRAPIRLPEIQRLLGDPRPANSGAFYGIAPSPDGKLLAVRVSSVNSILLVDAEHMQYKRVLEPGPRGVGTRSLAWSSDGRFVGTCEVDMHIWEAETGRLLGLLNLGLAQGSNINGVAFDRAGDHVFSCGKGSLFKWRRPGAASQGKEGRGR